VALIGAAMTTIMAALFILLFLLDLFGQLDSPYLGLLLFVAVPALFVLGLLLIPVGGWLARRQQRRHPDAPPPDWPVIDLRLPRQRTVLLLVLVLTVVNLVLISLASFGAVHAMEQTAFCGLVCHQTMEPEYVAHQSGPHARVQCVACHVGSGAKALVESKMAGTRQLWQLATNSVPTPVPSPVRNLRPARETCETCHWSEKIHGDKLRTIREYGDDEKNEETVTELTMHVGGGSRALGIGTGIHWHMNLDNEVEYVTTDPKRENIPVVRLRTRSGATKEFVLEGTTPQQIAAGETRRMDCLDCHNRPAHTMSATAERAVSEAIAIGRLPRGLPFVHREVVAVVQAAYPDRAAGLQAIETGLRERYRAIPGADPQLVNQAVQGAQDVWSRNVFPAMKVTWGTYPNHLGHVDTNGCFRCHDDNHKAADGSVIKQDCELCHTQADS